MKKIKLHKGLKYAVIVLLMLTAATRFYAQETPIETVTLVEEATIVSASSIVDLALSLDTVWMLLAAMLVFFMQPGFALVEAGFTRTKNTDNILMNYFVAFT